MRTKTVMSASQFRIFHLSLLFAVFLLAVPLGAQETVSVRVRFGILDVTETKWDGSASVSGGELLKAADWHPRPENSVDRAGSWRFSTHKGVNYNWRAYENIPDQPVMTYFWTPGVVLDIKAASGAEVSITTLQGEIAFSLRDVRLGEPLDFLGGAVIVDRVPTVEKLTDAGAEDDYPAVLGGTDGSARTAWVAFRDGADVVLTRNFQGGAWGPVETVTESPGDIHVVQLGRAGDGSVWFVWAEQREGNFDLYGRSLKEGSWGSTMRLTEAPQP
ncbi:MAG: hypothetical protein OXD46_09895, partial [Chloroflexi bacterium]|nr:hypothetical protein [Chloroflexota bacterium]